MQIDNTIIPVDAKKNTSRVGFALVIFMITFELFIPVLMQTLAEWLHFSYPDGPTARLLRGTLPIYLVALPIFWASIRKLPKSTPNHRTPDPLWFLILIPITLFFMVVGGIIGEGVSDFIASITSAKVENTSVDAVGRAPIVTQFILAVVIGPFFEELCFRKLLMDRLMAYSSRNAIILSAVTFAFFHTNIHQFFYAFGIGIVLAGLYQNTGNLIFPWALHGIANFFGGVFPYILPGRFSNIYYTLYLFVCALGLVLLIIFYDDTIRPKDEAGDLPRKATTPAMYLNPGMCTFAVLCILFTILSAM